MSDHDQTDHAIFSLMTGHFAAQVARTLAELRVPEAVHEKARSAPEVATEIGADPEATFRLLRAGATLGLLRYDGSTRRFAGTPVLERLRANAPDSVRHLALTWTASNHWQPWGRLADAVVEGRSQFEAAHGKTLWEYFQDAPDEARTFGLGTTELSAPTIREAAQTLEVADGARVVDVGGANGDFVLTLVERHPQATGVVFDLPQSLDGARAAIAARGAESTVDAVGGDFFASVPPADLHLVKFILHDWNDEESVRILRSCREALRPGGRIAIVDMVVGEVSAPGIAPLMDLNMLVMLTGRERDLDDFDRLFAAAGLKRSSTTSLSDPYQLIEVVPA